jgi:hypothetical protein
VVVSYHQNAGQNDSLLIANNSFKNVAEFKYLETKVTNQNCIHKEIKRKLNSENACCHSVQSLVSSHLLPKSYKTIVLAVVLYGYETWFLTLRKEHRLRMFENRMLRKIFEPNIRTSGGPLRAQ